MGRWSWTLVQRCQGQTGHWLLMQCSGILLRPEVPSYAHPLYCSPFHPTASSLQSLQMQGYMSEEASTCAIILTDQFSPAELPVCLHLQKCPCQGCCRLDSFSKLCRDKRPPAERGTHVELCLPNTQGDQHNLNPIIADLIFQCCNVSANIGKHLNALKAGNK